MSCFDEDRLTSEEITKTEYFLAVGCVHCIDGQCTMHCNEGDCDPEVCTGPWPTVQEWEEAQVEQMLDLKGMV